MITSWELSKNFAIDSLTYFITHATNIDYSIAYTDPDGMLPISKYVKKNSGGQFEANNEDFVIAKIDLHTVRKIRKRIYFDYSDRCVVLLNGTEIFRGNNAFRSKGIQFTGHLNLEANSLSLDLEKGENVLQFYVIEKANGWGLIGKLENESN